MNFFLIPVFIIGLIFFSGFVINDESLFSYSQSVYIDENDPKKPAPKILSFEQVDNYTMKVTWEINEHPDGIELKFFHVEITIGLDVDCCGPETNFATFEEANSEPIPPDTREFLITAHQGEPLKTDTEYCIEVEAQWPGPNLDSQPMCLIFNENFENISSQDKDVNEPLEGGGCLIATATFGSEMAPQVQLLRELRDNTILQTQYGTSFMTGFNQFYYSFSPAVADYERENPVFKETVKLGITPLLSSLTLLNYANIDSESEILGYGIGIILLNIGMYFVVPTILIVKFIKL